MTQDLRNSVSAVKQGRLWEKTPEGREANRLASRAYRKRKKPAKEPVVDLPGEVWRPVLGLEKRYAVSSLGRIKRIAYTQDLPVRSSPDKLWPVHLPEMLLAPYVGRAGYLAVSLHGSGKRSKTHALHVIVCEAFHGARPEGMFALHGDDNKTNNVPDNLRWGTPRENVQDAITNGRLKRGLDTVNARLTEAQVREILADNRRTSGPKLAARYKVDHVTIYRILRRETWRHITVDES